MNNVRIGEVYGDLNSEFPEICILEILKIEIHLYFLVSNSSLKTFSSINSSKGLATCFYFQNP